MSSVNFSDTPPTPSSSSSHPPRPEGIAKKKSARDCDHGIYKPQCRVCSPQNFCEHGRNGRRIIDCTICSSNKCPHGKIKQNCRDCNPEKYKKCEHGMITCLKCFPRLACREHPDTRKSRCKICGGREICVQHGQQKHSCAKCKDEGKLGKGFCSDCKKLIADCKCPKSGFAPGALAGSAVQLPAVQLQRPAAPPASAYAAAVEARMPYTFRFDDGPFRFDDTDGGPFDVGTFRYHNPFYHEPLDVNLFDGGKRKRKQRFTRRLRRRTHNTKKKNKMVKRKITKYSRKNKYKLK